MAVLEVAWNALSANIVDNRLTVRKGSLNADSPLTVPTVGTNSTVVSIRKEGRTSRNVGLSALATLRIITVVADKACVGIATWKLTIADCYCHTLSPCRVKSVFALTTK